MDPSTDPKAEAAPEVPDETKPAESSPATGVKPEGETLLERVSRALESKGDPKGAEASPAEESGKDSEPAGGEATQAKKPAAASSSESDVDADAERMPEGLSEGAQKRFRYLAQQAKTAKAELEQAKPMVEGYGHVQRYVQETGFTPQEFSEVLQIGALIKRDPARALTRLRDVIATLEQDLGEVIPDDLRDGVERGLDSEDTARRLARAEAEARRLRSQAQAREESDRVNRERSQVETMSRRMATAVQAAEETWRGKDSDAEVLTPVVRRYILASIAELGAPASEADAVKRFNDAVADAKKELRRLSPSPQAKTPTMPGSAKPVAALPKNVYDAARHALRKDGV